MIDPLTQVVGLLQPSAAYSKLVEGCGPWRIRRTEDGQPFYCAVLEGSLRLSVEGHAPIVLEKDDFTLIPAASDFTSMSIAPVPPNQPNAIPLELAPGHYRLGQPDGAPDVRALVGYWHFGSPDAAVLVSLLPNLIHVRGNGRLPALVQMVNDESRCARPGREAILARLVEVLMIEALRSNCSISKAPAGLLRGLDDERPAQALRGMHARPTWPWTVAELAREAALSRSTFFERFRRAVGVAPMEYLLHWRMALAKDLLRRGAGGVAEVAQSVGYTSASTFSVAFARHVGTSPKMYAKTAG